MSHTLIVNPHYSDLNFSQSIPSLYINCIISEQALSLHITLPCWT